MRKEILTAFLGSRSSFALVSLTTGQKILLEEWSSSCWPFIQIQVSMSRLWFNFSMGQGVLPHFQSGTVDAPESNEILGSWHIDLTARPLCHGSRSLVRGTDSSPCFMGSNSTSIGPTENCSTNCQKRANHYTIPDWQWWFWSPIVSASHEMSTLPSLIEVWHDGRGDIIKHYPT